MDGATPPGGFHLENKQHLSKTSDGRLFFDGYDIAHIIAHHGDNLKIYFPEAITDAIVYINRLFQRVMNESEYDRDKKVIPTYVTKTNHDAFVLRQVVKSGMGIETSAPFDIDLIKSLLWEGTIDKDIVVPHNGYKSHLYLSKICELIKMGFTNSITIFDDSREPANFKLTLITKGLSKTKVKVGVRVAAQEDPECNSGVSALGVGPTQVLPLIESEILNQNSSSNLELTVLHSFLNLGIKVDKGTQEHFRNLAQLYCDIHKLYKDHGKTPTLDTINIGGGMPVPGEAGESIDYKAIVENIVLSIQEVCDANGIAHPHIMTEFGTQTIGDSGIDVFNVVGVKDQGIGNQLLMLDTSIETRMIDIKLIKRKYPWYHLLFDTDGSIIKDTGEYVATIIKGASCDKDDAYPQTGTLPMPQVGEGQTIKLIADKTHPYSSNLTGGNRSHAVLTHCQTEKPKEVIVTAQFPIGMEIVIDPAIEGVRNEIKAKLMALGYTHTDDPEVEAGLVRLREKLAK